MISQSFLKPSSMALDAADSGVCLLHAPPMMVTWIHCSESWVKRDILYFQHKRCANGTLSAGLLEGMVGRRGRRLTDVTRAGAEHEE